MNSVKFCVISLIFLLFSTLSFAQKATHPNSKFDKHQAFSPLFFNEMANSFHSATGEPGPYYWQNKADYKIQATLDTVDHKVIGKMTLTYTNNSPYDLDFIWLQMDQNAFREDSRSKALYPAEDRNGVRTPTQGYELSKVEIGKNKADYIIDDTRMQIRLDKPLKSGKKTNISIAYAFEIPTHGKDRMGRVETENGWIYTIAQWFPRMAVFDEVEGWNTIPYLGSGEFYLEYGDYDVEITAPENMIVVGSGVLQNPKKVLTKTQQNRLDKAKKSEETVMILTKEEMLEGNHHKKSKNGMLTWRFKMENSRDFAWAASNAFIWDAAKMNLPNGKTGLAQSVYPAENSGQDGYARSTEYTKRAVEIYSEDWFPYPYEVATNVGAHEGGMEYPGIVFCSYKSKNDDLWGVINHEFGHIWLPMIVGSNERVYAWLDEGLNTFINDIATEKFNDGEYHRAQKQQSLGGFLFNEAWNPLFTRADVIHNQQNLGIEAYYKPAAALHLLREVVLGKDRFDYALQTYIDRWKYKHPQPWDFFNTMSNASGEDLGWFFKGWFIENWSIDQSVESIDYVNDDYKQGATITLLNRGEMPMPVELQINYTDNSSETVNLPVEIWMTGAEYVYHLDSDKKIKSAEIDPKGLVPDDNPTNNKLKKLASAPAEVTAEKIIDDYLEAIGGYENLKNIEDITFEMEAMIQGTAFSIVDRIKNPNKYNRKMEVFGQNMLDILINNEEVHLSTQGREQDLEETDKAYLRSLTQEKFLEFWTKEKDFHTQLLGVDELDGKEVYVVEISTPANSFKVYYDTKTNLKLKEVDRDNFNKEFSDYKEVGEFKLPHNITETLFGFGQDVNMKVKDIKINTDLKEEDFKVN